MPLYIRSDVAWTPNSLKNESFLLNDDDFVGDPDQQKDLLPQPYRMVDKIVQNLIDEVWENANQRESELIADASRFRPPQYECARHLEADSSSSIGKAECMTVTQGGEFLVLGLLTGVAVIQAETSKVTDLLNDENLHIVQIHTSQLADGIHVIATIDDMGQGKLYGLAGGLLYLLATLNEGNGDQKVITSLCEASPDGAYLFIHIQKPSTDQGWLEIHKLPVEAWIKDLEMLAAKAAPKDLPQESGPDCTGEALLTARTNTSDDRSHSSASHRSDRASHKFTQTTLHMKVLPPSGDIIGVSNMNQVMKSLDITCEVIGTGQFHTLTSGHLELRHNVFSQLHEDLMQYLPDTLDKPNSRPTCHFLCPGYMLPHSVDSNNPKGTVTGLAVWWSKGTQLTIYSLTKTAKELERRPDVVVPMSTCIVSSGVSMDGTRLVLALDNNNIVIWDVYMGCVKDVRHISGEGHVTSVTILDTTTPERVQYTDHSYHVMVTMNTGDMKMINCTSRLEPIKNIDLNVVKSDEVPVLCELVQGLSNLLLTSRENGRIYLHDLRHGNQLCEVTLPSNYNLSTPWQPLVCIGACGRMLYLKGESKVSSPPPFTGDQNEEEEDAPEDHEVAPPDSTIFVFQLRSFPSLDRHRELDTGVVPDPVQSTVTNTVDNMLKERLNCQALRRTRLQERWTKLRQQIDPSKLQA